MRERARMSTLHRDGDGVLMFVKGAPEGVLALCTDRLDAGGAVAAFDAAALQDTAETLAAQGLRVLAFALKRLPRVPELMEADALECGLTFIGLVGMIDPPRPEAAAAVAACKAAGIVPVMITGDHPATARAIARRLGLIEDGDKVLGGSELAQMSLADFEREVETVRVYARINPEQKIKIVRALQDQGEFVAMTGDGVNDAPALKQADIGVAMGKVRHRRGARGGAHDAARRQLRHHREGGARGAAHLRQHPQVRQIRDDGQLGRDLDHLPRALPGPADPAAADPHPVDQPRHRRPAGAGARRRRGRAQRHAAPAAAAEGEHLRARHVAAHPVGRAADGRRSRC